MTRLEVIQNTNQHQYSSGLIIDDNKLWNHDQRFTRINKYLSGDLHSFFDLVTDELLFTVIDEQFDYIFIGELFLVISLQSVLFNLETALSCLHDDGLLTMCISENCADTMLASYQKVVSRLEFVDGYQLDSKFEYVDEDDNDWTLINLRKSQQRQLGDDQLANGIKIGSEIAQYINKGKNISKLKAGFLQSNSQLDIAQFKAAYTTNDEMLGLYLQNEIMSLEPCFKQQYVYKLANFVFENRNSIKSYSGQLNLQQGNFVLAYDQYTKQSIVIDQQLIASYTSIFEAVWNCCIKQKLNNQLITEIEKLKE